MSKKKQTGRFWSKMRPISEGWYFWRKRVDQLDTWKWIPYFIMDERDNNETTDDWSFWESGDNVHAPRGGWWSSELL